MWSRMTQYNYKVLLHYDSVRLCSTKYYSTITLYYKVLVQYYSRTTLYYKVLCTTKYYSSTTLYYKVLVQYYSVLQSTTPVLLCTTKCYSSSTLYMMGVRPALVELDEMQLLAKLRRNPEKCKSCNCIQWFVLAAPKCIQSSCNSTR